ncbi:MAG: NlpC/P60 family protein [Prosthecobacter sp.]|uniref:C40 family peptidase n=1 Tax=Prosthecobacter sp. TaxID=1965333 RepID=UPI003BB15BEF
MHTLLRLLLVMLMAAGTGAPLLAATTSTQGKKSTKSATSSKKKALANSDSTPAKKTPAPEPVNEDPPTVVPTPAVVSTLSIEDISGFDSYPKQIQSLVQSCLALTHLELGYMYGSSEPSKGGMDCSGTIYHVLHFQGLKDVPRQSDEMCNWVDKKSHLSLTPTATHFDSEEFANLKPGDLLFWTNSLETTRKLPVTHVMIYLGKLKKSGKRVVFGSSDGRSYMGERRSGVSVFDFSLPKPDSTKHFYGYGPTPGLLPAEPEKPVIAAVTPAAPAPASTPKETAVSKETTTPKETAAVKETPAPKEPVVVKEPPATKAASAAKETPAPKLVASVAKEKEVPALTKPDAKESSAVKEEVRKAVVITTETSPDSATKKTVLAEAKSDAPSKASTAKPKTTATKKRSTNVAATTRRRTPAAPPKSVSEQKMDRAVSSVRRFFQP